MKLLAWAVLVLGLLWKAGAASTAGGDEPKRLRVLTSFLPVYCFAVNVAGEAASVENLLPANAGPHDYQFSRRDLQKINRADLILINGLGLESWLDRLLRNAAQPHRVVAVAAGLEGELITGLPRIEGASVESRGTPGRANPHIWLDPRLAMHAVTNVLRALQEADPGHAKVYADNAAQYLGRLEKLDADFRQAFQGAVGTPVVTYHDAFAYFARRYGLRVVGVIEVVPDVEPSPRYLGALRRAMREKGVKAVFAERQQQADRLPRQLAEDLKIPAAALDTLESGRLEPSSYEAGMRGNLRVFEETLKLHASSS